MRKYVKIEGIYFITIFKCFYINRMWIGNLVEDGCNPIKIDSQVENNGIITISHEEIEQYKEKFENWKGPKE